MSDQLSATFAALADPTRRAILARLASGEASVTELAKPFDMSMPAISKHLKVLERAGLVAHGREAQWRPRRLEPTALKEVHDWVEHYRQFWEQSLDRLDAYLQKLKKDQLKQGQPINENLKADAPKLDSPAPHGSKREKVHKEKKHVRNQRTK
ncbi:MAG TPA: metalloregulator ArsR/SmtB family transcription factor [Candidatus Acidoferrum sp.]|nr:metalloregulator ArsR/SmtB family transcription factor [Candidatus Acidoferrum sp.]